MESNFSVLHTALHERMYLGQASTAISMEAERFSFPFSVVKWQLLKSCYCTELQTWRELPLSNYQPGPGEDHGTPPRVRAPGSEKEARIFDRGHVQHSERTESNWICHHKQHVMKQPKVSCPILKEPHCSPKNCIFLQRPAIRIKVSFLQQFFTYSLTIGAWMLCWSIY